MDYRDYLPEKFRNAEISVHEIIKNNDCRLDGLSIRTEESNVMPTIYLNLYYAKLQDGAEMEERISIEDARDMAASMMPETKEMMYVLIVPKDAGCDRKER